MDGFPAYKLCDFGCGEAMCDVVIVVRPKISLHECLCTYKALRILSWPILPLKSEMCHRGLVDGRSRGF